MNNYPTITEQLDRYWEHRFKIHPIAYQFRTSMQDRWVRLHSLPNSKRYAENEQELDCVLSRHHSALSNLAKSPNLALVIAGYSGSLQPEKPKFRNFESLDIFEHVVHWKSLPIHELDSDYSDPTYIHFFVTEVTLLDPLLEETLRLVASDQINNVFILDLLDTWLYHPYDGGADIILRKEEEKSIFKSRFRDWLPDNSFGL